MIQTLNIEEMNDVIRHRYVPYDFELETEKTEEQGDEQEDEQAEELRLCLVEVLLKVYIERCNNAVVLTIMAARLLPPLAEASRKHLQKCISHRQEVFDDVILHGLYQWAWNQGDHLIHGLNEAIRYELALRLGPAPLVPICKKVMGFLVRMMRVEYRNRLSRGTSVVLDGHVSAVLTSYLSNHLSNPMDRAFVNRLEMLSRKQLRTEGKRSEARAREQDFTFKPVPVGQITGEADMDEDTRQRRNYEAAQSFLAGLTGLAGLAGLAGMMDAPSTSEHGHADMYKRQRR